MPCEAKHGDGTDPCPYLAFYFLMGESFISGQINSTVINIENAAPFTRTLTTCRARVPIYSSSAVGTFDSFTFNSILYGWYYPTTVKLSAMSNPSNNNYQEIFDDISNKIPLTPGVHATSSITWRNNLGYTSITFNYEFWFDVNTGINIVGTSVTATSNSSMDYNISSPVSITIS